MKSNARLILLLPLTLLLYACATIAEDRTPYSYYGFPEAPASAQAFSEAELDQMLAPIALYPDSLLSQILMAAAYPVEVVQAARWSRAHPGLKGEQAVKAVEGEDWKPSVKSLVAFPQVLAMLDEKLEWTQDLGEAFIAQPTQVMDTVQRLRQVAYDAGNLRSGAHYRIERRGEDIAILPATDEVVYVPYYDPRVVYGSWWWTGYPPIYWTPWPGYRAYAGTGFSWSAGIFVGPRFFFGFWDWPHRHVFVRHQHVHVPKLHKHRHKAFRHDPHHRHGFKHRRSLKHQFFAPPHVRLDPGARRHNNRAIPQRGIPRLGPRHDRLTTWPGFSSQQRVLPTPRIRSHRGLQQRGISTRLPWRVNTPSVHAVPRLQLQPRSASPSAPSFGVRRPFNGFRR